jgi:ferrochelatase
MPYDAILIVSFGGPERAEDVIPFLNNVLRGRDVPEERLLQVAEHYYHFGGRSPINDQCRALIAALGPRTPLPIYWGNRNWNPPLAETVRQMASDGVQRALAIATSAYSSYSSCRQYLEDIATARAAVGDGAPQIDKLPPFSTHPGFLAANADHVAAAFARIPEARRAAARLVFTAHSIPTAMAATCRYHDEILAVAGFVSSFIAHPGWDLVWQSRSGPPNQPWLAPDILDHLRALAAEGVRDVVAAPIGFISDHMEVLYDLDYEAAEVCAQLGVNFVRAKTPGVHPRMIDMFAELIAERQNDSNLPLCASDCCPAPVARRPGT